MLAGFQATAASGVGTALGMGAALMHGLTS